MQVTMYIRRLRKLYVCTHGISMFRTCLARLMSTWNKKNRDIMFRSRHDYFKHNSLYDNILYTQGNFTMYVYEYNYTESSVDMCPLNR